MCVYMHACAFVCLFVRARVCVLFVRACVRPCVCVCVCVDKIICLKSGQSYKIESCIKFNACGKRII